MIHTEYEAAARATALSPCCIDAALVIPMRRGRLAGRQRRAELC
ncbi:hypothetical protein ACQUFY_12515 [Robbsia andropogonis]|nr:hypothetical protein [Robbsia andropogonis]